MGFQDFTVHDITAFPLVELNSGRFATGFSDQWSREMEQLIATGQPFVLLLIEDHDHDETGNDRTQIILWCKRNRSAFADVCLGIVGIEPNKVRRALMRAQTAALSAVFGVSIHLAEKRCEAETIARRLLGEPIV